MKSEALESNKNNHTSSSVTVGAESEFFDKTKKKNTLRLSAENDSDIRTAAEILRAGGLVAFPTETVYGLGGNALDKTAAGRIYAAKGRPSDNPLIVHLADWHDADKYAFPTEMFRMVAERFMPGPITFILKKKPNIPDEVTGGLDSVGIRVPIDLHAHKLLEYAGIPVAAPSANISGKPSTTTAEHCITDLDGRVDAVLDGGESTFGLESTIVRETETGLRILRPGAVTIDDLSEICDEVTIDSAVLRRFDGTPEAPGMKYRHYAPNCDVIILDGSDESVYNYLRGRTDCEIFCYSEDKKLLSKPNAVSMGSRYNPAEQAHMLFALLRRYDGDSTIYARMPSKDGIGLAVFNRLIKAAGYNIIKL